MMYNVLFSYYRFRLKIIVSDNTDDATFVLFEKEVQKMLNKSASELLDIQEMVLILFF